MTELVPYLAILAAALAAGLLAWYVASAIKPKQGWQNGNGPIARWLDARRRDKFNSQLPDALATMSNALRSGFSMTQAFDSVIERGDAPISEEFGILRRQISLGMGLDEALASMSARVGSEDFTLVSTAISISRKTGGNVTEIFDRISETVRGRMKIQRKVKTLTAQGRMQGALVSAMPLILGAAMYALKPEAMHDFLFSTTGLVAVVVVLGLVAACWFLISKITRIDV